LNRAHLASGGGLLLLQDDEDLVRLLSAQGESTGAQYPAHDFALSPDGTQLICLQSGKPMNWFAMRLTAAPSRLFWRRVRRFKLRPVRRTVRICITGARMRKGSGFCAPIVFRIKSQRSTALFRPIFSFRCLPAGLALSDGRRIRYRLLSGFT
jgi:hypothetical protein